MIEGLRFLPQVQAQRNEIAEGGGWYLTCDDCPHDKQARRLIRCGWLPDAERVGGMGEYPGATVCPGYTTSLPEVYEAARALSWRRDGQLREFYDVPLTALLRDCVDLLDAACKQQERDAMREQQNELERGRTR